MFEHVFVFAAFICCIFCTSSNQKNYKLTTFINSNVQFSPHIRKLQADNILENPNKYDPISQGYAVDFDTAAQYCLRKFNGHLLSIQDAEELMFISSKQPLSVSITCLSLLLSGNFSDIPLMEET